MVNDHFELPRLRNCYDAACPGVKR